MMNILFVSSGNSSIGISPIISGQGESLKRAGLNIQYFPVEGKGWKNYRKAALKLTHYLQAHSFDIIHAHYGLSGMVAWWGKRKAKLPLVISFMGDDIMGSKKPGGKIRLYSRALVMLNKLLARGCYDHVILKSAPMQKKLGKTPGTIIPNGVNLEQFKPIEKPEARLLLNFSSDDRVVIFVANPARGEKNFPLVEAAVKKVNEKLPIKMQVIYNKPQEEIIQWLNAADVLVLSSYHEGSPNIIKEAMACNCPIVSTNVGDVRWVFGDTEGCHIAGFDPADFAEKIKSALTFSEKHGRTSGRERIKELGLDSESIAGRILDVYKSVLLNPPQKK